MRHRRAALLDGQRVIVGDRLALQFLGGAAGSHHAHFEDDRGTGSHAADQSGDRAVEAGHSACAVLGPAKAMSAVEAFQTALFG